MPAGRFPRPIFPPRAAVGVFRPRVPHDAARCPAAARRIRVAIDGGVGCIRVAIDGGVGCTSRTRLFKLRLRTRNRQPYIKPLAGARAVTGVCAGAGILGTFGAKITERPAAARRPPPLTKRRRSGECAESLRETDAYLRVSRLFEKLSNRRPLSLK